MLVAKILNTKIITRSNSAPGGWSKNILKSNIYKFLINLSDDNIVNSLEFKNTLKKVLMLIQHVFIIHLIKILLKTN